MFVNPSCFLYDACCYSNCGFWIVTDCRGWAKKGSSPLKVITYSVPGHFSYRLNVEASKFRFPLCD